jgi:hypothetical protein
VCPWNCLVDYIVDLKSTIALHCSTLRSGIKKIYPGSGFRIQGVKSTGSRISDPGSGSLMLCKVMMHWDRKKTYTVLFSHMNSKRFHRLRPRISSKVEINSGGNPRGLCCKTFWFPDSKGKKQSDNGRNMQIWMGWGGGRWQYQLRYSDANFRQPALFLNWRQLARLLFYFRFGPISAGLSAKERQDADLARRRKKNNHSSLQYCIFHWK